MALISSRWRLFAAFALSAANVGVACVPFTYYLDVANYQQYSFAISVH